MGARGLASDVGVGLRGRVLAANQPKVRAGPSVPPAPQYDCPDGEAAVFPAAYMPRMDRVRASTTWPSLEVTGPPFVSSVPGARTMQ